MNDELWEKVEGLRAGIFPGQRRPLREWDAWRTLFDAMLDLNERLKAIETGQPKLIIKKVEDEPDATD